MLKATVYMLNGDVYELPHGDALYEFLVGPLEFAESMPKETPVYSNNVGAKFFTLHYDGFFLTINRDAISHVEWGDKIGQGVGGKHNNQVSSVDGLLTNSTKRKCL